MKRRNELLAEAESHGIPRERAELLLEIAAEEQLDPELGLELVRRGLHVDAAHNVTESAADQPAADRYIPEWMFPATPPEIVHWERQLRVSFRRFRSMLEEQPDMDAAFRAYAREQERGGTH